MQTFKVSLAHFFLFAEEIKPVSFIHIYLSRTQCKNITLLVEFFLKVILKNGDVCSDET